MTHTKFTCCADCLWSDTCSFIDDVTTMCEDFYSAVDNEDYWDEGREEFREEWYEYIKAE